jgi:hypothetical protein
MPRYIVQRFLRESPSFGHIEEIGQACETSLTASAYRLCELSSFRVAMVWSEASRVRWYKPSEEFVRWVRNGNVREESYAFDAFEGRPVPPTFESVPASAWLFEKGLKPDARILEHSIPMPNYDGVLTLLFIPEEIEGCADCEHVLEDPDRGRKSARSRASHSPSRPWSPIGQCRARDRHHKQLFAMHFRLNPHHREREPRSDIRGRQLVHAGKDFGLRPLVHSIQTCVSRNPHDGHAPKEIGPTIHGDAVADWITIREEFA